MFRREKRRDDFVDSQKLLMPMTFAGERSFRARQSHNGQRTGKALPLSFFLVLRLQLGHNRRIGQGGCISQNAALGDIAQ